MTNAEIRAKILAAWEALDDAAPSARLCGGRGFVEIRGDPIPGVVMGGTAQCYCADCSGAPPVRAIETHCGGRGLVVGCPVCGRKWPR